MVVRLQVFRGAANLDVGFSLQDSVSFDLW